MNEEGQVTVYVLQEEDDHFLVELPSRGGYRYRSVDEAFGKFVAEHGQEATIPRLGATRHR